jgi:hypothetical protein
MTTKLIQILIITLAAMVLLEGVPELSRGLQNLMAGNRHSPQYNLAFWTLILIGLFAILRNIKRS